MHNTLEDIVHSSKMNDNTSRSLEEIFVANSQSMNSMDKNSNENHSQSQRNGFDSEHNSNSNININNNINANNNHINNDLNNRLSVNRKAIAAKDSKRLLFKEKKRLLRQLDETNGYINRNRLNSADHIVNPLLDTINSLTSCSDSSDECDISKKCYSRGERNRRIVNSSRNLSRKSCNYYYSSSDGDSVSGYTGTNSLESGYKSDYLGSNTPEVIDGSSLSSLGTALDCGQPSVAADVTEAVNQAISHQMTGSESNNTLKKSTSKQAAIAANERSADTQFDTTFGSINNKDSNQCKEVSTDSHPNQTSDDVSSNASVDSLQTNSSATNSSRKMVGMFSEKIANRLKAFNNESQLEHLLKLRKSLLKALKRCEQISSPANSRDGSPITAQISASSRSSSPASTVVKNGLNVSTRRLRDETSGADKSSPVSFRSHEELADSCEKLTVHGNSVHNVATNGNKSVRFNSSVKFSSVPNSNANPKEVQTKGAKQQISANYVSNKSILKDPLCETLRSAIKAGEFKNNCSLEGEIDELLYGRTGPYYYSPSVESSAHLTLSSLDECLNPSSSAYVSRIEDKYRTLTTSAGHGQCQPVGKQSSSQTNASGGAANSKKSGASLASIASSAKGMQPSQPLRALYECMRKCR